MRFLDVIYPETWDKIMLLIGAAIGTLFQFAFGGWTNGLLWLVCLTIGDFLTGTIAAFRSGEWNSDTGMNGVFRKIILFAFVSLAHGIDMTLADLGFTAFSFMSLTITALSVTEAGSIIENFDKAGCGKAVPPVIRQGLKSIREAAEKKLEGEKK
jgi:toxin secretion/phage lysis holin